MNMREKIARAICKASGDDWDREGPEGLMQAYGQAADAVLDALMEPTDGMKLAGGFKYEEMWFNGDDEFSGVIFTDMGTIFGTMIQAAKDGA